MVFVAIAVYAQSMTGFALALILLGLVGLVDLVPLPDAANAVTILIIVNALMFFSKRKPARIEPRIMSAVGATLVGVLAGMALLMFLATNAYQILKLLLGFSVVACAILLWRASSPFKSTSSSSYFAAIGLVSGLLGGLFAAAGPPLVYAVYRQPWPIERIQESLIFCFAVGAILRLLVMIVYGDFSRLAAILTIEAIPVTLVVTALSASRPPPMPGAAVKNIVSLLLVTSGLGTLFSSLHAIFA